MSDQSIVHSTFVIERSYPALPERVFAAFAEPGKKRRWFAEGENHDLEEFHLDFRIGGVERSRYRFKPDTPFPGAEFMAEGFHLDIVPTRRVVIASTMTFGDRRISASLVTAEIFPSGKSTQLILTHQGAFFEGSDGPQLREVGWQKLMDRFGQELQP